MIPGPFSYHRPASVADAVKLLSTLGDEARPLAGGHSLVPMMKLRLATPEHLVDLHGIGDLGERDGVEAASCQVVELGGEVVWSHGQVEAETVGGDRIDPDEVVHEDWDGDVRRWPSGGFRRARGGGGGCRRRSGWPCGLRRRRRGRDGGRDQGRCVQRDQRDCVRRVAGAGGAQNRDGGTRSAQEQNAQKAPESREQIMATLKQLGELKTAGILTDAEFEAKKKELLAKL